MQMACTKHAISRDRPVQSQRRSARWIRLDVGYATNRAHFWITHKGGRVIAQQRRCALTAHQAHNSTHTHMAECRDAKHHISTLPLRPYTQPAYSPHTAETQVAHAATHSQDQDRAHTTHACCGAGPWSAHQQPSRRWGSRAARASSSREARGGSGAAHRCASYGRA